MQKYDDHQSSSYDVEHCGWSNLPEDDFIQHEDLPYCIGEFVWTGFDYLGEPTPYYTDWPSHSSLFGIIDLAGLPKDRYYLYRSHWNKDKETLHILPHWNWEGREGEVTPVFVYTNYPSAELFINGKSQGKRTKDLSVTVNNSGDSTSVANFKRQQRYRLMWMDTKYEPGTVKVVAYDKDGHLARRGGRHAVHTLKSSGKSLRGFIAIVQRQIQDLNIACLEIESRQRHFPASHIFRQRYIGHEGEHPLEMIHRTAGLPGGLFIIDFAAEILFYIINCTVHIGKPFHTYSSFHI